MCSFITIFPAENYNDLKQYRITMTTPKYTEGKTQTSNSTQVVIGPFGAGQLRFNQLCSFFQNMSLHACTSGAILQIATQNLNNIHSCILRAKCCKVWQRCQNNCGNCSRTLRKAILTWTNLEKKNSNLVRTIKKSK